MKSIFKTSNMVKYNLLDSEHWKESLNDENPIVKHFTEKNIHTKLNKSQTTIMAHKFGDLHVGYVQIGNKTMNGLPFRKVVKQFFQPQNIRTDDAIRMITLNGKNNYASSTQKANFTKFCDGLYVGPASHYKMLEWMTRTINVNFVKTPCCINVITHDNGLDPMDYYLENDRYLSTPT